MFLPRIGKLGSRLTKLGLSQIKKVTFFWDT